MLGPRRSTFFQNPLRVRPGAEPEGLPELLPLQAQEGGGSFTASSEQSRSGRDQRQCFVHIDHKFRQAILEGRCAVVQFASNISLHKTFIQRHQERNVQHKL